MSKRWKPEIGDAYYFFNSDFNVTIAQYNGYTWDDTRIAMGNCFNTKDDAYAAAEKVKALLLGLHETVTDYNPLPKLTIDVFNHPNCPEWAKYAAVDADGVACYFAYKPTIAQDETWWSRAKKSYPVSAMKKFDASNWKNSLIERPSEDLSGGYKVGEWVAYYTANGYKYFKIAKIELNRLYSADGLFSLMCDVGKARPRPYNGDELRSLVGKVVDRKDGDSFLVTAYTPKLDSRNLSAVSIDGMWIMADDVLECYTIAGNPAGVLEHLNEKGEWVQ